VAGSLAQAAGNGGYLLRGDAMQMQVNLGRALDRRPLRGERLGGPHRPVEGYTAPRTGGRRRPRPAESGATAIGAGPPGRRRLGLRIATAAGRTGGRCFPCRP